MKLENLTHQPWDFIKAREEKTGQGVLIWFKEVPHPLKFYFDATKDPYFAQKVLNALGIVKKYLFSYFYLLKLVLPWNFRLKKWEGFLVKAYGLCDWALNEFYLKDEEYSIPVRETGRFVEVFLDKLGLTVICQWDLWDKLSKNFSKIVMMMLEFDVAYRFPAQDLFGELDKQAFLKNPRKEVNRILKIYNKRESNPSRADKVLRLGKMVSILLLLPKVKNAAREAIKQTDLEKIRMDKDDKYHVSYWKGYDFFGQDFDTRYQVFLDAHKNGFPPYKKKDDFLGKFLTE